MKFITIISLLATASTTLGLVVRNVDDPCPDAGTICTGGPGHNRRTAALEERMCGAFGCTLPTPAATIKPDVDMACPDAGDAGCTPLPTKRDIEERMCEGKGCTPIVIPTKRAVEERYCQLENGQGTGPCFTDDAAKVAERAPLPTPAAVLEDRVCPLVDGVTSCPPLTKREAECPLGAECTILTQK